MTSMMMMPEVLSRTIQDYARPDPVRLDAKNKKNKMLGELLYEAELTLYAGHQPSEWGDWILDVSDEEYRSLNIEHIVPDAVLEHPEWDDCFIEETFTWQWLELRRQYYFDDTPYVGLPYGDPVYEMTPPKKWLESKARRGDAPTHIWQKRDWRKGRQSAAYLAHGHGGDIVPVEVIVLNGETILMMDDMMEC